MRCRKRFHFIAFTSLWLMSAVCAHAQVELAKPTQGLSMSDPVRFQAYGDNYAAYQWVRNTGWTDHWEGDLQGHFSFGYSFKRTRHSDVLFTYAGEFDFYLFDRASGPVVNRLNNPALHYVHLTTSLGNGEPNNTPIIDIGFEHESDGQVQEVTKPADASIAQENYAAGNRPFFDQISRGSNFVSLSGRIPEGGWFLPKNISLQMTARAYVSQDYDVTWGPEANKGKQLDDYNLLRTRIGWHKYGTMELQWTIGKSGLKDDSFDFFWQLDSMNNINKLGLPLFIKYHHGPLNTVSNYTQPQDAIGIGLRFSSFTEQDRVARQ